MHIQCIEAKSTWNFPQAMWPQSSELGGTVKGSHPHNPPANILLDTGTVASPLGFLLLLDPYLGGLAVTVWSGKTRRRI